MQAAVADVDTSRLDALADPLLDERERHVHVIGVDDAARRTADVGAGLRHGRLGVREEHLGARRAVDDLGFAVLDELERRIVDQLGFATTSHRALEESRDLVLPGLCRV